MTLPALLLLADCGGDWDLYVDDVYEAFLDGLIRTPLRFRDRNVGCRRYPETRGRSYGFWHLIQEGPVEEDRLPDIRRCERIPWIRYIVENADTLDEIDVWESVRPRGVSALLWYNEEYIVVLGRRPRHWLLLTAYCTDKEHRRRALRKERDTYNGV